MVLDRTSYKELETTKLAASLIDTFQINKSSIIKDRQLSDIKTGIKKF